MFVRLGLNGVTTTREVIKLDSTQAREDVDAISMLQ
jgi:hypothetical protein